MNRLRGAVVSVGLALAACAGPARSAQVPLGSVLLVACGGDGAAQGTLLALRPQTGTRLDSYPAGPAPTVLTVTRDGRRAIVSGPTEGAADGGGELSVLDLTRGARQRRIPLGDRPRAIALLDRRTTGLVALDGPRPLVQVDLAAAEVEALALPPDLGHAVGLAWSADGARVWIVDDRAGSVVVGELRDGAFLERGRAPLPAGARGAARLPATGELWIPCREAACVARVDAGDAPLVRSVPLGGAPVAVAVSNEGARVVVADAAGARIARLDGRQATLEAWIDLTPAARGGDATPGSIVVEPGGRFAFVALVHARRIAVVDLESDAVVGSFATPGPPLALAWTWLRTDEQGMGRLDTD